MGKENLKAKLDTYRYEFLLVALLLLIFDKVFFIDNRLFLKYAWPFNMVVIAIACFGIFIERSKKVKIVRNIFSIVAISMPFTFAVFVNSSWFLYLLTYFFIVYYIFIFTEVMYQITQNREIRLNVIIGSFCGYMLLSMIALFTYLAIELNFPHSFHGISYGKLDLVYNEMSYFSFITLTSIGFGDIYPKTDMARLVTAFFGMVGQFYMVAVVGIIISKFTSK
jgi:voltage-gated potassium channel